MSRVKKPGRPEESQAKRRRRRPTGSDPDEDGTRSGSNSGGNGSLSGVWTPRHLSDLKVASIYNRNSAEAPAELYRKDLISAMKLPDSEPLTAEEYWLITDPWKQEWEKGVQVPVNPESLPESQVVVISPVADRSHDFRLPKKKYVRVTHDDFFNPDYHQLVSTAARAEKVCSYDLDDVDAAWLGNANSDRVMLTLPVISEFLMEQVIEELELQCWEQVQTILKSQEGLGIEYDENVICDVCRSPESEEGNEMVFCDSCNICVHQACYGITSIPSGSFLCRTCTLGIRPSCILCPNMGGAMKATRSGHKWAHVACAIWIPEVSIGSVEKMEPITKISAIPQSRWSLICVICKEKSGACIQCSVKTCKTAYHVICAFKNGLEMKPIIVDENAEDGIKLRSYCEKHSVNTKKEKTPHSGSEEDGEKKKSRAMTAEERNLARAEKLQQIEAEFFKYVRLKDVSQNLAVDMDIVNLIYNYWKLKRKSLNNRPLVPPRPETTQLLTQQQEQDLEQMKMFVQLRQDLERVRNLCYMVSRREKLSRSYFRLREQAFQKQVALLSVKSSVDGMSLPERAAILDANHGPSIYDQVYSQNGTKSNYKDFESLVTLIAGDERPEIVNGIVKTKTSKGKANENPYKKTFVNGARRRSESLSSLSEIEISGGQGGTTKVRKPLAYLFDTDSSMDAVIMSNSTKTKALPRKKQSGKSRGLKAMDNKTQVQKTESTSESELDLPIPVPKPRGKASGAVVAAAARRPPIYSDTESDSAPKKSAASVVTKGALKEFSKKSKQRSQVAPPLPIMKSTIRVSPLLQKVEHLPLPTVVAAKKKRGRVAGRKKKLDSLEATELIVPQREAAKKASESIRSVKKGKELGAGGAEGGESPGQFPSRELTIKEILKGSIKDIVPIEEKQTTIRRKSGTVELKGSKLSRKLSLLKGPEVAPLPLPPLSKAARVHSGSELDESAVSIVPQRQAAKKAAEHIRSCQSNVVATRLIIEDEMEASRKKSKQERSGNKAGKSNEKSPSRGRPPNSSLPTRDLTSADSLEKGIFSNSKPVINPKQKYPVKGGESLHGTKPARKDLGKSPRKEEPKNNNNSGWPFLDKGSQSACRRSRERSSSSSSTSSGSTSTSDSSSYSHSSSSSSRSSSPGSASPGPKASPPISLSTLVPPISAPTGPGKKLKTSERLPSTSNNDRTETSPRAKPLPKGVGPPKPGPRRGTATPTSPSTSSQEQTNTLRNKRGSVSPGKRTSQGRNSLTTSVTQDFSTKKLEEKSGGNAQDGREGKPGVTSQEEKALPTPREEQKRTPPKTLIRDELALSSDSEEDVKPKSPLKGRGRATSRPSLTTTISPELKNRPMPKTKKRELGLLSEDSASADEKENNSCLSPSPSQADHEAARKAQKPPIVPGPPISSLLSPLAPSEDNKDSLATFGAEPQAKRPRVDSPCHHPASSSSTPPSQVQSLATPTAAPSMPKSIFSPVAHHGGKDSSELLDFDNDLYDLARSVTVDYGQEAEDQSGRKDSLSFSFSQDFLSREDNKEDSARATINLVEKLRLQHKRMSSGGPNHRPSIDDPLEFDDITSDELPPKSPNMIGGSPVKGEPFTVTPRVGESSRQEEAEEEVNVCDLSNSPTKVSRLSPERTKPIGNEGRWIPIPPNNFLPHPHPVHASLQIYSGRGVSMVDGMTMSHEEKSHVNLAEHSTPKVLQDLQLPHPNFHSPHLPQGMRDMDGEGQELGGKEAFERMMAHQSHHPLQAHAHHGLLMEVPDSHQNNHVTMTTTVSQSLQVVNVPPGLTAGYSGNGGHPPLPFHPTHPAFLPYQMNSTLANVVTSLAGGNLPFFHTQAPMPNSSPKLSVASPLNSPPLSYPMAFAHQFGNLAPPSLGQHVHGQEPAAHNSPGDSARRRSSDSNSNSLGVVTSGMPVLSKPPLTSPSLLLASNNAMTAPPPPPQSTVAQIIESVIQASNNHGIPNSTLHQLKSGFGLNQADMNFHLRMNQFQPLSNHSLGNSSSNKSPLVSPDVSSTAKQPSHLGPSSPSQATVSDFSAILSNKTNENILPAKSTPTRDYAPNVVLAPSNSVVSPKGCGGAGRGRRPATPKGRQPEKGPPEETSPRGKGRGERKANGASPGRGSKGFATPRRGNGRGKYKGKNVLVRKDLAGTVYDIDFDEFEENSEDKFDLRSLRDRRKSSDAYSGDYRKSDSSEESPARTERSPRQKPSSCENNDVGGVRSRSVSGLTSASSLAPVDMRTVGNAFESQDMDGQESVAKVNSHAASSKHLSNSTELASLLIGSVSSGATVKELDELDKTLEALTSPFVKGTTSPKSSILTLPSVVSNVLLNPKTSQLLHNSGLGPGGDSSLSSSKDSFTTTFSEDNHSRNQLKVKIKGPFLDANYISSNSIPQPTFIQSSHHHLHHQAEPGGMAATPMMNNPLRRMRKKELLRQYCNQDMNMDGRYTTNSSFGGEYGMVHPHFHPYGRAVITIPKAVASMEIIPSGKDDYGLELSDLCPLPTPPPIPIQEKKKRSRGVNREMAALGLIEKGERWREVGSGNSPGSGQGTDNNSRKRIRSTAKPNRSTFVPPTLVAEFGGEGDRTTPQSSSTSGSGKLGMLHSSPGTVTAVNHPTPKLKIKFADLHSANATCTASGISSSVVMSNDTNNHSDAKRAKGRPPKKRGISGVATPPPPPMEELKRQSLMFREMIMKDFADADDRGGKKKKKSKRSKRGLDGETDDSNRSKSPDIKIINEAGGPKLILRFGKNRTVSTESPLINNNIEGGGKKENGPGPPSSLPSNNTDKGGEHDSGFTGSSEGSGGSWTPSVSLKTKFSSMSGVLRAVTKKREEGVPVPLAGLPPPGLKTTGGGEVSAVGQPPGDALILDSAVLKFKPTPADPSGILPSTSNSVTPTTVSPTISKGSKDKVMPIRLKLHRCYEGYATTKEVDRENTNPKQSDSCEVR